jgi:hypothetical protein
LLPLFPSEMFALVKVTALLLPAFLSEYPIEKLFNVSPLANVIAPRSASVAAKDAVPE